ncbi:MAG: hypothetical protein R3Y61_05700 [Rikenellaceae bacterium]
MKKLFLMLVVATFALSAVAQDKEIAQIEKKLEKSDEAIANPKKAESLNTWLDRAGLFADAYVVYTKNLLKDIPVANLTVLVGEPSSIAEEVIAGVPYSKYVYPAFDMYVTSDGIVAFWESKKEMVPNAMQQAVESVQKAREVDAEGFAKSNKAKNVVERITAELASTGISLYSLEKFSKAATSFRAAFDTQETINNFDSVMLYYSGLGYVEAEQFAEAIPVFEKLISVNFLQEGHTYYYFAAAQKGVGDVEGSVATFESAFAQFPQNPNIMAGLINAYLETNRNPEDVVVLIKKAEELDPKNVSLYLVESDIWEKAGNLEKAYEALDAAIAVDPSSIPAYFNYAVRKVVESDAVVEVASKLDINDVKGYNDLVTKAENLRKESLALLEKCMEIDDTNADVLSLIGQMYFICRDFGDDYAQKLEDFRAKYPAN